MNPQTTTTKPKTYLNMITLGWITTTPPSHAQLLNLSQAIAGYAELVTDADEVKYECTVEERNGKL